MGVPLVIIHFRMGFSMKYINHPVRGDPHDGKLLVRLERFHNGKWQLRFGDEVEKGDKTWICDP